EKRRAGSQPGREGKWRSSPLIAEQIIPHYPSHCAACNQPLIEAQRADKPYMGHYVLELETSPSGFQLVCQLHHYYQATCGCGHRTKDAPGVGYISSHWYERGQLCWLWVAISTSIAVFHIGSRRKEELSQLLCETFRGWLVTDGYGAYRSHDNRQRCLAHLIRKAIAIAGSLNQKAAQIGEWILADLRELIATDQ
ncbi:MAG: IS66 family transposase, partial [Microcystaceae cyanobacterium]